MVEACEALDRPYVVIENDPAIQDDVRAECEAYVFGDAMGPYAWEKAKLSEARVILSMTSSEVVSRRVLELESNAPVILRARDERTARSLLDAGADYVAVPDLLAGEQLIQELQGLIENEQTVDELRSSGFARVA